MDRARSGGPRLARLLVGASVADVVDPAERWDDLLVVRDDDDRCCEPLRHLVQDADHGQRPFAVERRRRLVGEDDRWLVDQRTGDGDALLLATVGPSA